MPLSRTKVELIAAFSIVNFCFTRVWVYLFASEQEYLSVKIRPDYKYVLALLCNIIIFSLLLWAGWQLVKKINSKVLLTSAKLILWVIILLPLNYLRTEFTSFDSLFSRLNFYLPLGKLGLIVSLVLLVGIIFFFWLNILTKALKYLALLLSPLVLFNFAQASWNVIKIGNNSSNDDNVTAAPIANQKRHPKILWIIFDELDYGRAFEKKDPSVHLPNLDQLRSQSLHATKAYSPSESTPLSISSLLTGKVVRNMIAVESKDYKLIYKDDDEKERFLSQTNIFATARQMGINVGVVGWHLAYGRIVADSTIRCDWYGSDSYGINQKLSFAEAMQNQLQNLSPFQIMRTHKIRYQEMMGKAKSMIADQRVDFMYLHLAMPHRPFIYDRYNNNFRMGNYSLSGYLDNLVLMDRSLGEIRLAMEEQNRWDESTVIVSSDHPWRDSIRYDGYQDKRVPFLVKLPNQINSITLDPPFNTVLTYQIFLSIIQGKVQSPQDIIQLIDDNRNL